ncbi:LLM class F420-dependent oxidoreductase [Mangrovimicrobium sediminis]|uniref:LLM class F420-dependent oxidoreductase n=1 Tax=Mangrovimicrobium sediminis TaxID=2562682 RepID=A0A4Z0LX06_9GAMM|nr:LLM class F420-dependent oxidoreductase [Haliea sp. SAOS-164]TGD71754.1 LLM class F420-dependent oxidoreductase [Haliea sp. SAOS-164]
MQLGASYPTTEVTADPQSVRKFVRAIEEMGYDYIMAYDHVVKTPQEGREPRLMGPYTEKHSFQDPFVFFAFAAALTDKLGFVTGVLCLPQRQTALVAQQAADVDLLSGERLRLGVGIGWNYVEFEALGADFRTRGRRADEQIEVLRKLWAEPVIDYTGEFHRIDRGGINPRPRRQVPLWVGGHSEPGYKRGARLGDGFIFAADGKGAVEAWGRVRHYLAEYGRDEAQFGRELLAQFALSPQQAVDDLRLFRDAGGQYGCIPSMNTGLGDDIDAHIDYLAAAKRLWDAG